MDRVHRSEGRRLFGADPAGYERGRPDYPAWIFDSLEASGALYRGAVTLEIGPGSGLATRDLIERGSDPITLVEPDERLADRLRSRFASAGNVCAVLNTTFEDAEVPEARFDLVAAATAFHWIEPSMGFEKARKILKPGGILALFWNVFQDLDKSDPFHEATRSLLANLASSPSGAPDTIPFALDRVTRQDEAKRAGFEVLSYEESRWTFELPAEEIRLLYGNFSSIQRLPAAQKESLLDALTEIATTLFAGRVSRNMTSCLYQFMRA